MISAIVLAAGQSRRMGTQKLLLPFRGKPMIAVVVDELLHSSIDEVIVVTGESGNAIGEALVGRDVHLVSNPDPDSEMLHSVRCGLTAVAEDSEAVLVALGDQPAISADVVGALSHAFRTTDRGIVVPTHKGKRGHPLLVSTGYREEILKCHEGRGMRGLLESHPQDIFELAVDNACVLEDIDLPEDYRRAIARNRLS